MSAPPVEATEPEPAANSLPNDQTVNEKGDAESQPVKTDTIIADQEFKDTNGSANVQEEKNEGKPEVKEEKSEKNGDSNKHGGTQDNQKPFYPRKNLSKYDPSVLETTDDPKEIRSQVEFYFGDTNLPADKHMWAKTEGAANKPVPLAHLLEFKRMKRFQPVSAIIPALRDSPLLNVSGEEGAEEISRKVAYDPTIPPSAYEARSIYAKGFGEEERGSQFDIEAFFAPYGPTREVRLRRHPGDKLFKGSVFVEFDNEETAKKFLELDPKPLWKGTHELEIKSKREYVNDKAQDIRDGKTLPGEYRGSTDDRRGGRGRGYFRGGRDRDGKGGRGYRNNGRDQGDRDPDNWKKRREEDRASGFKDDKHRGGSRNGRNNRGGHRGNRDREHRQGGQRNNDRNREREEKNGDINAEAKDTPVEGEATKVEKPEETPTEKRVREDDDGGDQGPAKKVDTKSEATAEAS